MRYQHVVLDSFSYPTWNHSAGRCRIECRPVSRDRVVVIATELEDNLGMSITNAAELVATEVAKCLELDPHRMVWIEHYGYPDRACPSRERTYDRVAFGSIRPAEAVIFRDPHWRQMTEGDWRALGLTPPTPSILRTA